MSYRLIQDKIRLRPMSTRPLSCKFYCYSFMKRGTWMDMGEKRWDNDLFKFSIESISIYNTNNNHVLAHFRPLRAELSVDFFPFWFSFLPSSVFKSICGGKKLWMHDERCRAVCNFEWTILNEQYIRMWTHLSMYRLATFIYSFRLSIGFRQSIWRHYLFNFSFGWARHIVSNQHPVNRLYILLSRKCDYYYWMPLSQSDAQAGHQ